MADALGLLTLLNGLELMLAMVARIIMLGVIVVLASLTRPIIANFSIRNLILLAGGRFLLYKAVREIHHTVEFKDDAHDPDQNRSGAFAAIITQIILLDIVFSVDSVITAVGLTQDLWIIVTAVVLSFVGILFFARPIGDFILRHPALKILALSLLITIGVTIFMEGLHKHVPKAYIYLPMGFALMVEMLQIRYAHNQLRRKA
jgi:predicted tellurium resistance membrane protein TerC